MIKHQETTRETWNTSINKRNDSSSTYRTQFFNELQNTEKRMKNYSHSIAKHCATTSRPFIKLIVSTVIVIVASTSTVSSTSSSSRRHRRRLTHGSGDSNFASSLCSLLCFMTFKCRFHCTRLQSHMFIHSSIQWLHKARTPYRYNTEITETCTNGQGKQMQRKKTRDGGE